MSVTDYLLMRTPSSRLKGPKKQAEVGKVSGSRVAISFAGIILGIIASFYVTGLRPTIEPSSPPTALHQTERTVTQTGASPATPQPEPASQPTITTDFSWRRFLIVCLISLVICGITYQGLYFSLRLYQQEPTFLILFVSFQYGYFWQSVVKGAATTVATLAS
jgi:hypothetical protein